MKKECVWVADTWIGELMTTLGDLQASLTWLCGSGCVVEGKPRRPGDTTDVVEDDDDGGG